MIALDRRIPFVDAVLAGRTTAAASLLSDAEQRHGLWFAVLAEYWPEDNRDEWYESHLWPFLSETHFVVTAGDLFMNDWSLSDAARVDHTPSWRQWGGVIADWANRHWVARPAGGGKTDWSRAKRPWEYLDFYMDVYLTDVIEGYLDWRNAILRVLDAKERGSQQTLERGGKTPSGGGETKAPVPFVLSGATSRRKREIARWPISQDERKGGRWQRS